MARRGGLGGCHLSGHVVKVAWRASWRVLFYLFSLFWRFSVLPGAMAAGGRRQARQARQVIRADIAGRRI
jgi:hypothetical protein